MKRSEHIHYKDAGDHIRGYVDYNASAGVSEEQYYYVPKMECFPTVICAGPTKLIEIYEINNSATDTE